MTKQEYQKRRRDKAEARWFKVLAKRREGLKWREVGAFFGIDTALAHRWATNAEECEIERKRL